MILIVAAVLILIYVNLDLGGNSGQITLSGTAEAVEIDLAFKSAGRLEYIRFDEGERLTAGDTVAELSHSESEARISQIDGQIGASKAQLRSLEIQSETVSRNLEKITNLVQSGGATMADQEDLEDKVLEIDAAIDAARKSIEAQKSQRHLLRIMHDDEYLIAPANGTVLTRAMEPGEITSPGKTVLTIADLSRMEIKVYLPEVRLGNVRNGQQVKIMVDSWPDSTFAGVVSKISDKAEFTPKNVQTKEERVKTVYAVTVSSDDHNGILKPGMPCDVIIEP